MTNIFEKATRQCLRFNADSGPRNVEELWRLSIQQLDSIYKALKRDHNKQQEESLLVSETAENEELSLKIDIVTHVVKTLLAEQDSRKVKAEKAMKKQRLLSILADKQDEELVNKSTEEIEEMLATL